MSLNIKNERVLALARDAARASGQTQTGAIETALIQYLERVGADPDRAIRKAQRERVHAIAMAYCGREAGPDQEVMRTEDLYDSHTGLPR